MTAVNGDAEYSSGELLLSGLSKFTRYSIVVQAYNEVGQGPLSEPVSAQTLEDGRYSTYTLRLIQQQSPSDILDMCMCTRVRVCCMCVHTGQLS